MAKLLHEIWIERDEMGQLLEMCCLAGPDGDGARRLNRDSATLWCMFEACSTAEATTIYHQLLDREPFKPQFAEDAEPYTDEAERRQGFVIR